MNHLLISVIAIFLPGVIGVTLIDVFTKHREVSKFKFLIFSIIFGYLSYLVTQVIVLFFNAIIDVLTQSRHITYLSFWQLLSSENNPKVNVGELFIVSVISIVLSIFFIHEIEKKKLISKIGEKFNIAYRGGGFFYPHEIGRLHDVENVSIMTLAVSSEEIIISGEMWAYDEDGEYFSCTIRDATVRTFTGDYCYHAKHISIQRKIDDVLIACGINNQSEGLDGLNNPIHGRIDGAYFPPDKFLKIRNKEPNAPVVGTPQNGEHSDHR